MKVITLPTLLVLLLSCVVHIASTIEQTYEKHGGWGGIQNAPSETECRSFIEKALEELRSHTDTNARDESEPNKEAIDPDVASEEISKVIVPNDVEDTKPEEIDDVLPSVPEDEGISTESNEVPSDFEVQESATDSIEETTPEKIVPEESLLSSEEDNVSIEDSVTKNESNLDEITQNEEQEHSVEESQTESVEVNDITDQDTSDETAEQEAVEQEIGLSEEIAELSTEDNKVEASEEKSNEDEQDELNEEKNEAEEEGSSDEKFLEHSSEITESDVEPQGEQTDDTEVSIENEGETGSIGSEEVSEKEISEEVETEPAHNEEQNLNISDKETSVENEQDEVAGSEEFHEGDSDNVIDSIPPDSLLETDSKEESDSKPEDDPDIPVNSIDSNINEITEESDESHTETDIIKENEEETSKNISEEEPQQSEETESVEEKSDPTEPELSEDSTQVDQIEKDKLSESDIMNEDPSVVETVSGGEEDSNDVKEQTKEESDDTSDTEEAGEEEEPETPEEDLAMKMEVPENLRNRDHITAVLRLDSDSLMVENKVAKTEENVLKDLKRLYETAIKPLEILYKYRDLSNRHFGDPEIFSKPLILFMGPWSGGKSTIINYLLDNEYKKTALRTGAEPSPAYFNIVMWGEREEILDGTQLAADWTFSGLQKFGQGLLDRLRGLRLTHPLLEKVNIVEIPGILEIRKQVERLFPFNDACQWFIDRADIIFLVYDPSKLDVGPETEAILDQLKGREYQTRIILNKADQVHPEELMRVQGTLIWNISPLMSSTEPPVMYSTSLWSTPYESGSPARLLLAQEKAFLKDLRQAIDNRVENKIASARRFAVRVRNHAKMVDCYLTTYYNHKSFFGNRQKVADDIIEHPQNYHIYEGLSTLTNISRYDLPDPDVYRDFFRLNPVYDFQQLASTCTYFRGCPINRLDVAIAYDLPELVGKYKTTSENVIKNQNLVKTRG